MCGHFPCQENNEPVTGRKHGFCCLTHFRRTVERGTCMRPGKSNNLLITVKHIGRKDVICRAHLSAHSSKAACLDNTNIRGCAWVSRMFHYWLHCCRIGPAADHFQCGIPYSYIIDCWHTVVTCLQRGSTEREPSCHVPPMIRHHCTGCNRRVDVVYKDNEDEGEIRMIMDFCGQTCKNLMKERPVWQSSSLVLRTVAASC